MTFPTFLKNKKIISGAAIIVALIIGFFLYRGYSQKTAPKPSVAKASVITQPPSTSVPTSQQAAKIDKPSPKPKAKSSPPPKVSASKPKVNPPAVVGRRTSELKELKNQTKRFSSCFNVSLDEGINVHLSGEPQSNIAEPSAETQPVQHMTDEQLAEAYKKAVREGWIP